MLRLLASSFVLFASGTAASAEPVEKILLAGADAVAYGAEGDALFRADLPFLLGYVGTEGQVFQALAGKVRISPDGQDEVWLHCSDLSALASCGADPVPAPRSRGKIRGGGIPNCPGDPRCPKAGSK